jgi:hypothetical protein
MGCKFRVKNDLRGGGGGTVGAAGLGGMRGRYGLSSGTGVWRPGGRPFRPAGQTLNGHGQANQGPGDPLAAHFRGLPTSRSCGSDVSTTRLTEGSRDASSTPPPTASRKRTTAGIHLARQHKLVGSPARVQSGRSPGRAERRSICRATPSAPLHSVGFQHGCRIDPHSP